MTAPAICPPDTEEPPEPVPDSAPARDGEDVTVCVTTEPPTVTTVTCVVGVSVLVDDVDSSDELDEEVVVAAAALEEVDDSDSVVDVDVEDAFCSASISIMIQVSE